MVNFTLYIAHRDSFDLIALLRNVIIKCDYKNIS